MRTLKDIMTDEVECVTLQDNVFEIATIMKKHDVGFVPVVDGKKLIGVVTDRDLVIRGYAEKRSGSAAVSEVISDEQVVSASPDTTVDEAAKLMATHKIRRLPVVENGELIGVVAIGDLAVRDSFENEAGEALSEISEGVKSR